MCTHNLDQRWISSWNINFILHTFPKHCKNILFNYSQQFSQNAVDALTSYYCFWSSVSSSTHPLSSVSFSASPLSVELFQAHFASKYLFPSSVLFHYTCRPHILLLRYIIFFSTLSSKDPKGLKTLIKNRFLERPKVDLLKLVESALQQTALNLWMRI